MSTRKRLIAVGATLAVTVAAAFAAPGVASAICPQPCKPPPTLPPPQWAIFGTEGDQSLGAIWNGPDQVDNLTGYTWNVPSVTFKAIATGSSYPIRIFAADSTGCSIADGPNHWYESPWTIGRASLTFTPDLSCGPGAGWSQFSTQAAYAEEQIGSNMYATPQVIFNWRLFN
jgi:hypothetical protein